MGGSFVSVTSPAKTFVTRSASMCCLLKSLPAAFLKKGVSFLPAFASAESLGFADADARDLFLMLLGVSGVGPKIALATLAVYEGNALRQALADGDVTALTRVPGIGKRGAERMVLELRDKVGSLPGAGGTPGAVGHAVRGPVVEALVGLGFALKQAEDACDKVLAEDPDATTASALRAALSALGKK